MAPAISQAALNLIITEEVSSEAVYIKLYQHPTWPQGASGVTIGIGFDCGYVSRDELTAAWSGLIPDAMIAALHACVGVHGEPARALAVGLRGTVTVPWDAAVTEFTRREMPKWIDTVCKALPNTGKLAPDCLGALVSLAYNRGASFAAPGDRYTEMRAIKAHMAVCAFDKIPAEFLAMRRLWPQGGDLWRRRGHEAALFEQGLKATAPAVAPPAAGAAATVSDSLWQQLTHLLQ
jgi:GH24 family phage-related lysozyme (muramidase)